MNSITYDICGEQKLLKVESDLILVIFMGESRKSHKCVDSLRAMMGEVMLGWRGIKKNLGTNLLPDLLKNNSLSDCALKF